MLGWISLLLFTAAGLNIFLGSVVLARDWRQLVNRVFFILTLTVGLWDLGIGAFLIVDSQVVALIWAKLFYASALLLVFMLVCFTQVFPNAKHLSLRFIVLSALPIFVLILLLYMWPGFIAFKVYITAASRGVTVNLAHYFIYGLFIVGYFTLSLFKLYMKSRNLKGMYARQAWWFFVAGTVTATIGLWYDLILPHWLRDYSLVWVGPLATTIFAVWCAVIIIRYGLFDIRQTTMRAIAYILTLLTLSGIYYVLAYVISSIILRIQPGSVFIVSPINIALALVLAFIFQPIKRIFDRVTNFIFYRDVYSVEDFFARLTKRLSIITDLNVLLQYSSSEIRNTLKASFGAFYIYQIGKPSVYVATDKRKKLPKDDADMLDAYVTDSRKEIIITKQLNDDPSDKNLKRMLDSHRIALVLPITKDSIITGYLFLGEHLSAQYTLQDTRALLTIADELTIAIQNALSVQQVRDLNETLQQRVNEATKELRASNAQLRRLDEAKDEFVSMASHQLRTPLTSIKGYISMVREGDVGKISEPQDQMLGQAFASSERMVHLINDFLNVSRLQTGKFMIDKRPVNLAKVIEQELDSLVTNAKSRNLEFTYTPPKHFPTLNLDEDKMRQVIMNFSDNAIYYSAEGTKIKVKLAVEGKDAIFTVTDTGIGVPRSEQSQLFNKFYRASNARRQRPDGTGVGLFLAKKVIDAHGGQVVFESVEGKGSTFGFRLPIDQLATAGDADDLDDQDNNN